jgi:3-isopropylmalate dehydrogenase
MKKNIAVLAGDGIGPEVMSQALRVLKATAQQFGHDLNTSDGLAGGAAYDKHGTHLPEETKALCQSSDAILFGSVGGPVAQQHLDKWKNCEANSILSLRKLFSFNANLRPVRIMPELQELSPLKAETIQKGVDLVIVRELLGDCYFGEHKQFTKSGLRQASDLSLYTEKQIADVAHTAFRLAKTRRKKVTSVDKANVLTASKLWRAIVKEIAQEYPDIQSEDLLVDNCAMQLVINPSQFDVVLTTNMFGDILSDVAAVLPGSLGLLASASLNASGFGLYEPPGGSAPDIAGKDIANPIAQINSVALLLRLSFGLEKEALAIEQAVESTLKDGFRTKDIYRSHTTKDAHITLVSTHEMTDQILKRLSVVKN